LAHRLDAQPPVDRRHARARKVVAERDVARVDRLQAGALQPDRRPDRAVPLGDTEITEHPGGTLLVADVDPARKSAADADGLAHRVVHRDPRRGRSPRIAPVEPVEPPAVLERREVLAQRRDDVAAVGVEIGAPDGEPARRHYHRRLPYQRSFVANIATSSSHGWPRRSSNASCPAAFTPTSVVTA